MVQTRVFSAARQTALFTLGISSAAAAVGLWVRWRIGSVDLMPAVQSIIVVAVSMLAPAVIIERSKVSLETGAVFYGPLVALFVLLTAVLGLMGADSTGQGILLAIALLSVVDLASRRASKKSGVALLIYMLGLAFGSLVAINIQGGGYLRALTPELMPLGRAVNPDTFMHLAHAQMVRYQHAVSTGVDGVTPQTMYILAHALIGWLAELFGRETAQVAANIHSIIFVPLMLGSALSAAISLTGGKGHLVMSATIVGVGSLVYPARSYFISETYAVALFIFMSIMIPVVAGLGLRKITGLWGRTALAAAGLTGILLATFGKASVGILSAGLFGLAAWVEAWRRPSLYQRLLWMSVAAIGVCTVMILGFLAVVGDQLSSVVGAEGEGPYYPNASRLVLQKALIANAATIIALAWLWFLPKQVESASWRNTLLLFLAVFAVAANVPGVSRAISLGQHYIINVQMWFALPVLAAVASLSPVQDGKKHIIRRYELALIVASFAFLLAASGSSISRYLGSMKVAERYALQGKEDSVVRERQKVLNEIVSYRDRIGQRLRVYIPPGNTGFWTLIRHCEARTMIIPAATGVPVIDGFPPLWTNCSSNIKHRGWQVITPRINDDSFDENAICNADQTSEEPLAVYVLESFSIADRNTLIDCSKR